MYVCILFLVCVFKNKKMGYKMLKLIKIIDNLLGLIYIFFFLVIFLIMSQSYQIYLPHFHNPIYVFGNKI